MTTPQSSAHPNKQASPTKLLSVNSLLWLALALALAGSLKHLAAIFASIDGNSIFGWLQAVAIDAGLFALAYSIRVRKVAKRSVKPLWFGVTLFTGISIYGNLAYGLLATTGNLPAWIVASRPYVLAASLPVLVLFLSELLSDDRQHSKALAEKEARKATKVAKTPKVATQTAEDLPPGNGNLNPGNDKQTVTKVERKQKLADLHTQNPKSTVTKLAAELGVSRGTVRNYASELGIELATGSNGRGTK